MTETDTVPVPTISEFWKRGGERQLTVEWRLKDMVVAEEEEEQYRRDRNRIRASNKRVRYVQEHGRKKQGKRPVCDVIQPVPSFRDWLAAQETIAQPEPAA